MPRLLEALTYAREYMLDEPAARTKALARLMGPDPLARLRTNALKDARHATQAAAALDASGSVWAKAAWDDADLTIRCCVELGLTDDEILSALKPAMPTVTTAARHVLIN